MGGMRAALGVTPTIFQRLFDAQHGRCAICQTPLDGQANVDHDHVTGAVRGVLCSACNYGLGFFRDTEDRLHRAAEYLRHYQQNPRAIPRRRPRGEAIRGIAKTPEFRAKIRAGMELAWTQGKRVGRPRKCGGAFLGPLIDGAEEQEIVRRYAAGERQIDIAKALGLGQRYADDGRGAVRVVLRKHGIPPHPLMKGEQPMTTVDPLVKEERWVARQVADGKRPWIDPAYASAWLDAFRAGKRDYAAWRLRYLAEPGDQGQSA